jgi:tripeptidyl-peptidase-1
MSTPGHPTYGQHFKSHEEMKQLLMPSEETVSSVTSWLKTAGIQGFEIDADWITFTTTVGVANTLLGTQFSWFANVDGKSTKVLRTLEYTVPDEVAEHISLIQPTTHFDNISAAKHIVRSASNDSDLITTDCDLYIVPQCLKDIYKIDYTPDPKSGSKAAIASFREQYARYRDLALFERFILPEAAGQNFSVLQINGGLNDQNATDDSVEANLDTQYMIGIAHPLPVTEHITGGRDPGFPDLDQPNATLAGNEPYLAYLHTILKLPQKDLPQVISISYGIDEQRVPKSYALTICNLFAQLGSRGVSVLIASGDNGPGTACVSNDGKNTTKFQVLFPASCPWVTAVGATMYRNETAALYSSGGFSDYWKRPSYQDHAVQTYLGQLGDRFEPYFDRRGRGVPDVAALGSRFVVFDNDTLTAQQGTSCSSPVFGGIIALLNDARLRSNKLPLGFLNPWLYANPHVLNDATLGGSVGCNGYAWFHSKPNGSPVIPYAGWNATLGWDPVTGLGTPNFPKLLGAAMHSGRS